MVRAEQRRCGGGGADADQHPSDEREFGNESNDERRGRCGVVRRAGDPTRRRSVIVVQVMNGVFGDFEGKRQQHDCDSSSRHPAPMTDGLMAHSTLADGEPSTSSVLGLRSTIDIAMLPLQLGRTARLSMERAAAITTRLTSTFAAVVALLAVSVLSADIPPTLEEDRSQPGFCSPDCPLQHDAAHSVAVAPVLGPSSLLVAPVRREPDAAWTPTYPAVAASPDAPRAPPST